MKHNTIRIYGKSTPIGWHPDEKDYPNWKEYAKALHGCIYEVSYTEHHITDGKLDYVVDGTEDFTVERAHNLTYRWVYGWLGKYNRGGHKVWEEITCIKVDRNTTSAQIREWATATELTDTDVELQVRDR